MLARWLYLVSGIKTDSAISWQFKGWISSVAAHVRGPMWFSTPMWMQVVLRDELLQQLSNDNSFCLDCWSHSRQATLSFSMPVQLSAPATWMQYAAWMIPNVICNMQEAICNMNDPKCDIAISKCEIGQSCKCNCVHIPPTPPSPTKANLIFFFCQFWPLNNSQIKAMFSALALLLSLLVTIPSLSETQGFGSNETQELRSLIETQELGSKTNRNHRLLNPISLVG